MSNIKIEDKVKIIANIDDHVGYKEGQIVEVIGYDDMGYFDVEGTDGTQWYVGEEEIELVKKGSGKHENKIAKELSKTKKVIAGMRRSMASGGGVGKEVDDQEFQDWWFEGGEETADAKYGKLVTKTLLKKQPSYPNEGNAYSEALWELAKKDNAHKKMASGGNLGSFNYSIGGL